MNINQLLNSFLKQGTTNRKPVKSENVLGDMVGKIGGAAIANTLLSMVFKGKGNRGMGSRWLTQAGLTAMVTLGFQAYQSWQAKKQADAENQTNAQTNIQTSAAVSHRSHETLTPKTLEDIPLETGEVMLLAMIMASKADGEISEEENQLLMSECEKLQDNPEIQAWMQKTLQQSPNPNLLAPYADNATLASQIYVASLCVIDDQNAVERTYLNQLAKSLRLEPHLVSELENAVAEELAKNA